MKISAPTWVVAATFVSIILPSVSAAAEYESGFVWKRSAEYRDGTIAGATTGNPFSDSLGNESWMFGWTTGGALDSTSPWIFNDIVPMVWDDDWWPVGQGRWARYYDGPGADNNGNPPIGRYGLVHDLSERTESVDFMPVVSWSNPTDQAALVNIKGNFTVVWEGSSGVPGVNIAPAISAEVAIGAKSASRGTTRLLYETVLVNPLSGVAYGDTPPTLTDDVDLDSIALAPDEVLTFSLRGLGPERSPPTWVALRDDVRIIYVSPIPEPYMATMFPVGLAVMWGVSLRRRRESVSASTV